MQQLPDTRFAPLVRTLRVEISPRDFHPRMLCAFNAQSRPEVPAEVRLAHYFETVRHWLAPALRKFVNVRTLHLTTTYDGMKMDLISKNELMIPCFETLCNVVRKAELSKLEELQLGLPYYGGYGDFFQLGSHRRTLKNVSKSIRTATIKLYDYHDNFTIMPIF